MVTFSIIFEDHEVLVIAGGMAGRRGGGGVGGWGVELQRKVTVTNVSYGT